MFQAKSTPVTIPIGNPVNFRGIGPESILVRLDLARQGHGKKGTAVKGVFKSDNRGSPRGIPSHLYSILHSLGTTVDKHRLLGESTRRDLVHLLGQLDIGFVHDHVKTGVGEPLRLILDRLDHTSGTVAHIHHPNATGKVDEFSAFNVLNDSPLRLSGKKGRHVERPPGNVLFSGLEQILCL